MRTSPNRTQDPVYLNCRRETLLILASSAVFFLWVTGYCGLQGYRDPSEPVELAFGMPSWVFWGVLIPWLAASVFTIWFCLGFIVDDPLEPAAPDVDANRSVPPNSSLAEKGKPGA
ncbi:MAG: DUF997 domain-containing protein [Verrucomicrobia bacterium]|nr:DUF997 domain-containing protein [Verrucomicrobiota bacterium]